MTGVLHTARINAIEVIVSSDKLIKMVNFKPSVWEVMGFDSCRGLRIFLCPTLVSCWLIHLHIHATLGRSMSHRSIANCTPVNLNTLNTSISLNQIAFQSTKTVFGMTLSFIYRCIFYEYNLAPVTAWRGHWMLIVSTNFLWQSVAGCVITILR